MEALALAAGAQLALAYENEWLYVHADKIKVFDASDPGNILEVTGAGEIRPAGGFSLVLHDGILYVTGGSILRFDVTDPAGINPLPSVNLRKSILVGD